MKEFLRRFGVVIYCLLGFVLTMIAYYPGFISPDGLDQYGQSLSGQYDDWHPPVMAAFWRLLHLVWAGPQTLLVVQLVLLWWSVYVLLTISKSRLWRGMIIFVSLAPFVQNFAGFIIKDSQMTFSWLLAAAFLLRAAWRNKSLSWPEGLLVFVLLTYGCWVRINAFTAVLPLCYWFARQLPVGRKMPLRLLATLMIASWMMAGRPMQTAIFHPEQTCPEHKMILEDITGIYAKTGDCFYPGVLLANPDFDTAYMRLHFHPATFDDIWCNPDSICVIPDCTVAINKVLKTSWLNAIKAHPGVYLHNRWDGFLYFMRIKKRNDNFYTHYFKIEQNKYGFVFNGNALSDVVTGYISWFNQSFLMKPWFWCLLNILLLFFARGINHAGLQLSYVVLVLSAFLYWLPQFFLFQVDTDFRYFYWVCIACSLAMAIRIYAIGLKRNPGAFF